MINLWAIVNLYKAKKKKKKKKKKTTLKNPLIQQ